MKLCDLAAVLCKDNMIIERDGIVWHIYDADTLYEEHRFLCEQEVFLVTCEKGKLKVYLK